MEVMMSYVRSDGPDPDDESRPGRQAALRSLGEYLSQLEERSGRPARSELSKQAYRESGDLSQSGCDTRVSRELCCSSERG